MIAQAMDFNHLPVQGGLYDQHPELLRQWLIIFQAQAEHQRKEQRKRENSAPRPQRR